MNKPFAIFLFAHSLGYSCFFLRIIFVGWYVLEKTDSLFLVGLLIMIPVVLYFLNSKNSYLKKDLEKLQEGQLRIAGIIENIVNNQNSGNANILAHMEGRLSEVQKQIFESLSGSATSTAQSLGALQERLSAIDKAQANLEKLSGDVLGLQDILSNKQTRGVFGEIQLKDIVSKALPPNTYDFQVLLKNGKRVAQYKLIKEAK